MCAVRFHELSPSSIPVELRYPIRVSDCWPQAALWHLKEAKRWKAVRLLSRSCKYPQSPLLAVIVPAPFHSALFCFIMINDKAAVYAYAYLCLARQLYLKRHASQLRVAERSARQRIKQSQACLCYNKYQSFHFSSGPCLYVALCILSDSPCAEPEFR